MGGRLVCCATRARIPCCCVIKMHVLGAVRLCCFTYPGRNGGVAKLVTTTVLPAIAAGFSAAGCESIFRRGPYGVGRERERERERERGRKRLTKAVSSPTDGGRREEGRIGASERGRRRDGRGRRRAEEESTGARGGAEARERVVHGHTNAPRLPARSAAASRGKGRDGELPLRFPRLAVRTRRLSRGLEGIAPTVRAPERSKGHRRSGDDPAGARAFALASHGFTLTVT
jgi:hypothetical protein